MPANDLVSIARAMVAPGKGILAADESTGTIERRFDSIKVENVEENRRAYRDMLFTTKGLGDYISGVILYDETIRQKSSDGTPFVELACKERHPAGHQGRHRREAPPVLSRRAVTEGLDGLPKRCAEYVKMGAKFAKWRAVITIGKDIPSATCIEENAHALARYAAICQEAGLVPIVEPEVLMDGDHTIDRCEQVTEWTLNAVYDALYLEQGAARRVGAEAQHGHLRKGLRAAGRRRRSRRTHREGPEAHRAWRRCRRRVPVRRTERRSRDRASRTR